MIEPTVGRVVWFFPPESSRDPNGQPLAATIAKVLDDRHINVGALLGDGTHFAAQNIVLLQDGDHLSEPDQAYACWMPYQKGQAAKAEKLELQLAGTGSAGVGSETKAQQTGAELTARLVNFEANGSLKASDAEAASHAVAPRVTLADIEGAIAARYDIPACHAVGLDAPRHKSLEVLSLCLLVMTNGFTIVGKSAPASPENFNADFGRKLAYEDCIRQLWPLMGFALRDRLSAQSAQKQPSAT